MVDEHRVKKELKVVEKAEEFASEAVPNKKQKYFLHMFYPRYGHLINEDDVLTLIEELKGLKTRPNDTVIDMILSSSGGDPGSAYKMMKLLRSKCCELNSIIPLYGNSAATLMVLASDKIYMAPQSELGPLDMPMEHPTEEGIRISALDGVKPIGYFSGTATNLIKELYSVYRSDKGLGRKVSIELAQQFAADYVNPIISKLDPILVSKCYRELEIAEKYGTELLASYMFSKKEKSLIKSLSESVILKLIWGYPSHNFAIGLDEARKMKLEVFAETEYEDWDYVWEKFLEDKKNNKKSFLLEENKESK